ncbi:MAG: hypothetical protein BWY82_00043 [Verrucomicrobia bacterium ADurb.Bin474]|nr:MAG: hypothetical protein BWY82_00043 [Verrucomicrobia bacterium ADurb.Bin474]
MVNPVLGKVFADGRIIDAGDLFLCAQGAFACFPEKVGAGTQAVKDTHEIKSHADGPVDRIGVDAQHGLDFIHQGERIPPGPVTLVDKGEDRHTSHATDLKELAGLRFDPLCRIDHHDCGVDRGQHAEGVFGEVLVTWGVNQVDDEIAVIELHHSRADRNPALRFHGHPVGGGGAFLAPCGYRARHLKRAAIQQEFLGKGGLASVRV